MYPNTAAIDPAAPRSRKSTLWIGRVFSALPVLMLLFSASMKFSGQPQVMEQFSNKLGYPAGALTPIGLLEIACTLVYVIPNTAVLGAVLLTGYLGGAIATHLRIGEPFVIPLVLGFLVWGGLYLRDQRLRSLLPLRRATTAA